MKKLIWLFSIISFMFIGCGNNSDKREAKELLQKILQVVGIPYDIVVNICQDDNGNGVCESFELQTKIKLSKGDTFEDIIEKIRLTEDGKYFLETRDPKKPILLELQDRANVLYNDGKFTLMYQGFKTNENNEKKELSILTSMVDNGFLNSGDIDKIRNLKNQNALDRFYAVLLSTLEKNINTLSEAGFDMKNAVLADLKEMSIGLIEDGIRDTLPQDLYNCGSNMECVDNRLKVTETKTTITKDRVDEIKSSYITSSDSNSTTEKKLLVSKMVEEEKYYGSDSTIIDSTKTTTIYKYSGNRLISYHQEIISTYANNIEDCNLNYDSENRYIGDSCKDSDGDTSRTEIIYEGDKIVEENYYSGDGKSSSNIKILEWSGDKPIKVEFTDYESDGGVSKYIKTIKYRDNNPIYVLIDSDYSKTEITREFDNKRSPYYWDSIFQNGSYYFMYGFLGENNIVKEITKTIYDSDTITSIKDNKIEYNSANMPIKIESTINSETGDYREVIVTTYEYIELK